MNVASRAVCIIVYLALSLEHIDLVTSQSPPSYIKPAGLCWCISSFQSFGGCVYVPLMANQRDCNILSEVRFHYPQRKPGYIVIIARFSDIFKTFYLYSVLIMSPHLAHQSTPLSFIILFF